MIYIKYNNSVNIDKENLMLKIDNLSKKKLYFRNIIYLKLFLQQKIIQLIMMNQKKIKSSIENNGFENTANLYSISDSSKVGGKIGWD